MSSKLLGITRPGGRQTTNPPPHGAPGLRSRVRLAVVGPDGEIKKTTDWVENIMCTFGLASLASMVGSGAGVNASTLISACKIGTGTTAATSNDTSLVASSGSVVITAASMTKTNLGNRTVEYQHTFASNNPAGAAQITEVGLFCNSTADSQCAARTVLTGANSVNKGASDSINLSYDVIFTTG
jgi:hypothetical protein